MPDASQRRRWNSLSAATARAASWAARPPAISFWRARRRAMSAGVMRLRLAHAEGLERRHHEEALAELAGGEPGDHHVLVGRDADEALALEPAQRLHHRDAAHPGGGGDGIGHHALPGGEPALHDGLADIAIGQPFERFM